MTSSDLTIIDVPTMILPVKTDEVLTGEVVKPRKPRWEQWYDPATTDRHFRIKFTDLDLTRLGDDGIAELEFHVACIKRLLDGDDE